MRWSHRVENPIINCQLCVLPQTEKTLYVGTGSTIFQKRDSEGVWAGGFHALPSKSGADLCKSTQVCT